MTRTTTPSTRLTNRSMRIVSTVVATACIVADAAPALPDLPRTERGSRREVGSLATKRRTPIPPW
jgi:hypothetical protein